MEKSNENNSLTTALWNDHRPMVYILGTAVLLCFLVAILVIVHFQFGENIPGLAISHPTTAQYWGQIGDFVGGILNPTLSFFAFITLLYTLKIQSDELKEAREESRIAREEASSANRIQEYQTKIFERQSFESAFFGLLSAHQKITENIKFTDSDTQKTYIGKDALSKMSDKHLPFIEIARGDFPNRETTAFRARSRSLLNKNNLEIGHYFRSLYQILKYIDSYGKYSISPTKARTLREINEQLARDRSNYVAQRQYSNMLRAQFSSIEIDLIFANCLTPQGKDLKYYVEKYSFLKTFNRKRLKNHPKIVNLYDPIAYKDYEEITQLEIIEIVRSKPSDKAKFKIRLDLNKN
jgi:hypothetical protein